MPDPHASIPPKPIAVVRGAAGGEIQRLLRAFVDRHASARIAGVVEDDGTAGVRRSNRLRSLGDGADYPVFQDLGSGASGCALDGASVVLAGEAVRDGIAAGCDLVVLSKFGKMEAESGSGLVPAFIAALEAGVPVLTSVAPKYAAAWDAFASPLFDMVPAEDVALDRWWNAVRGEP